MAEKSNACCEILLANYNHSARYINDIGAMPGDIVIVSRSFNDKKDKEKVGLVLKVYIESDTWFYDELDRFNLRVLRLFGDNESDEYINAKKTIDVEKRKLFKTEEQLEKIAIKDELTKYEVGKKKIELSKIRIDSLVDMVDTKIASKAYDIDIKPATRELLSTIDKNLENDYLDRIMTLDKCIRKVGGFPNAYWAGEDWKLAFSIGNTVYQTPITPIGEDYKELDEIIEKVFMGEWVTGTLDYFKNPVSKNKVISRIVHLDASGERRMSDED